MTRTSKIIFGGFLLLILLLTYLEATEPEPVNWTPSYTATDKIPLGSFVFYKSWMQAETRQINEVGIPPFEKFSDSLENGSYFFLNNSVNFDPDELDKILNWVSRGNQLFIAARGFSARLLDTLHLETNVLTPKGDLSSKPKLNFTNSRQKTAKDFQFKNEFPGIYFKEKDSATINVLGDVRIDKTEEATKKPNFISAAFGAGKIFLHSTPEAFGNYFLLTKENYRYSEKVLAHLNKEAPLYLDEYYKAGKTSFGSPLYVLLSNKHLKWAYYFLLLGCVLFIIFEGKRKQRAIPVVKPLKNQSYEYAKTVGDLYLEEKAYKDLIQKKIELFLEYVRSNYKLSTKTRDEEFYNLLASKSGKSKAEGKKLFEKMEELSKNTAAEKSEFFELSEAINNYKNPKNGTSGK
ncbi:protein of unknown function [Salegentibacter echinorum]|uniref:DUF4350 domain-containing protein n=1 Tax=Salegentibacter echinorum TaxID=1073325 RepID=A0A1M5CPA9_SALEC|nr:DUF4350 domain-containing protein [Salegentibacter echinorum]SHF56540.1 protein of unknown function [Salegentibacter echinorum]